MAYSAEISRANPTCFVLLVDQSGSMADPFGGESGRRKAEGVADATNKLLQNLVLKCAKEEGIRDYFQVGLVGYGGATAGSAFAGSLGGRELVPISEIGGSPARIEERSREREDGAGGLVRENIKFPVWVDPVAQGGTPMCGALSLAKNMLSSWVSQHRASFPPVVINITDGEATDGDPTGPADALRSVATDDGSVLLLNIHVSSNPAPPVSFPESEALLPDKFARLLFQMSSLLTPTMRLAANKEGIATTDGTRGFVFNAGMPQVIKFLDIGTRPSNLR